MSRRLSFRKLLDAGHLLSPQSPTESNNAAAGWYLASIAAFMIPAGIHMVVMPYLLAIELGQSPQRFGITQMFGQLPVLLFLLLGGWLADRIDPRRILMVLQSAAILMPLIVVVALKQGVVGEALLLLNAFVWGCVTAFVMPARDGLLKRVSGVNIQRMVTMAIGVQFGSQMVGQAIGGLAAHAGAASVMLVQCLFLVVGVYVVSRLPVSAVTAAATKAPATAMSAETTPARPASESVWRQLVGGLSVIFGNPSMRGTFLLTVAMGVFFGGVFLVVVPLAIRDLYAGSARDIAFAYVAFGIGTLLSVATLMKRGGLRRPGRALVVGMLWGCLVLVPWMFAPPLWMFYFFVFTWGMGAGVTMTMSRTVLQELAPASHQSRVMAAHAMSTSGGGPIGALIMGFVIAAVSVRWSLLVPVIGVVLITAFVLITHPVWTLRSRSHA